MRDQNPTLSSDIIDVWTSAMAFLGVSKVYLFIIGGMAWIFSTYDLRGILILFTILTVLDTITRMGADAIADGEPFRIYSFRFWKRMKSAGLKMMGRKIFVEYGIAVLVAFMVDVHLFKSALNFNVSVLKLNIPMCAILFFTGIELWSVFENLEEAGYKNWLKRGTKAVSGFIPDKWTKIIDAIKSSKK